MVFESVVSVCPITDAGDVCDHPTKALLNTAKYDPTNQTLSGISGGADWISKMNPGQTAIHRHMPTDGTDGLRPTTDRDGVTILVSENGWKKMDVPAGNDDKEDKLLGGFSTKTATTRRRKSAMGSIPEEAESEGQ